MATDSTDVACCSSLRVASQLGWENRRANNLEEKPSTGAVFDSHGVLSPDPPMILLV